jgi:4-hydroxy-tetrahydrodipicolinate reductase
VTRVAIFGAGGQMGATVARTVGAAAEFDLVAAVDPIAAGRSLDDVAGTKGTGLTIASDREDLIDAEVEMAIDFTVATAARANLEFCAANGIHAVSGTTGLAAEDLDALRAAFPAGEGPNCVIAPNFSISAVVLMHLAEVAAPFFDSAEIVELHHDRKRDAPSGTSIESAERIARARAAAGSAALTADPTATEVLDGARGALGPGGVRIHSVRLHGLVAHEEILFGTAGQSLTLRQDSYDRESFMPGVLLALRSVAHRPGLTLGLDLLLFGQ